MRAAALWTILWVAPGPRVEPRDGWSRGTLTPPHLLATLATCVCVCVQVYVEVLHTLETAWMKGILARRRWHRWYHAIIAMNRYST